MARGFQTADQARKDNTSTFTHRKLILKNDGDSAEVRVLEHQDQWVNLMMHSVWQKLMPTRCTSDNAKDPENCPLCAHGIARRLVVYIPVRVRDTMDENQVNVIEASGEHFQEIVDQIQELPPNSDMTDYDFKVKRSGAGKSTRYRWHIQLSTKRPLNAQEKALEIPNLDELIVVPDADTAMRLARTIQDDAAVQPIEAPKTRARF